MFVLGVFGWLGAWGFFSLFFEGIVSFGWGLVFVFWFFCLALNLGVLLFFGGCFCMFGLFGFVFFGGGFGWCVFVLVWFLFTHFSPQKYFI